MKELTKKPQQLSLVKAGTRFHKLVQSLRKDLTLGQMGFLTAGEKLYHLKKEKFLYKGKKCPLFRLEDMSRKITWQEFCSRPEFPFPTTSRDPHVRAILADKLIKNYELFVLRFKIRKDRLGRIGYSKLFLLAPILKDKKKLSIDAKDWLSKAEELTQRDLLKEIRSKDASLGEILECTHPEDQLKEVQFWRCSLCGKVWRNKPEKKTVPQPWKDRDEVISALLEKTDLESLGEPIKIQRMYASRLIKKYKKEDILDCIDWLLEDKFWETKLNKVSQLYYQMPRYLRDELGIEVKVPEYAKKSAKKHANKKEQK